MVDKALEITLIGMGGVFFFLLILMCVLNILSVCVPSKTEKLSKIAAVLALIKSKE
ncbi:MAG: OadG family protein [Alphaproteobacteria bacterium]|nr:OadG family protein [Alphaproteobacteria bacterium]